MLAVAVAPLLHTTIKSKEAGMEHDSNNNGPFSFAQNNHLIHWEGKFGCGTMGDDRVDDDGGGRDIDFAPPHNCKFSMLAAGNQCRWQIPWCQNG
jgi:hypothetical protein